MLLHRLSSDPAVEMAANETINEACPTAMSAFSLVELKGNYIQCLILLQRKISDSDSIEEAFSRILNTGGRRSRLMLEQLISHLGGSSFQINPWSEAQLLLRTHLDAQIEVSHEEFKASVDWIADDFKCQRAFEEPQDDGVNWSATIPRCSERNASNCRISAFIKQYIEELQRLVDHMADIEPSDMTSELSRIRKIVKKTIDDDGRFPWVGSNCRSAGDLLIGLQSKAGLKLLSSNYKEHGILHQALGYTFEKFPVADIRLK